VTIYHFVINHDWDCNGNDTAEYSIWTVTPSGSYELVLHTVIPGMMSELVHRVQQGLPSRLEMAYPPPLGFWYSDFGPNTTFCHIWPHENLDKRAEHRRELFHNEEWRETWRDTMKFMQGVQVKALVPTPFSPLQ